jgi:hypothetical protein
MKEFIAWVVANQTKLLGGATVLLSTLVSLAAAGQLDGLIEPVAIKWLGIANVLVGALTGRAGFSNTKEIKVAEAQATVAIAEARVAGAIQTAIEATPPQGG